MSFDPGGVRRLEGVPVAMIYRRFRTWQPLVATMWAAVAVTLGAGEAFGQQLRVAEPTRRSFGEVDRSVRVGNTNVSRNFGQTIPGVGREGRPTGTLYEAGGGLGIDGRRIDPGRDLLEATPERVQASRLEGRWRTGLSPFGAARYVRRLPNFGAMQTREGAQAGNLLNQEFLLATTAFSAPARVGGLGAGGLRDAVLLADAPEEPLHTAAFGVGPGPTDHADLMASRLAVVHKRSLNEGWEWFRRGEYQRAHSCFESAEMLDRSATEARMGEFFCLVAEHKYYELLHVAAQIYRLDSGSDLFNAEFHLPERYEPEDVADPDERRQIGRDRMLAHVQSLIDFAGSDPPLVLMAAESLALWHAGFPGESVQLAQRMIEGDPHGPYGRLGKHILKVSGEAAPEPMAPH